MKIYVAGKWSDSENISKAIDTIEHNMNNEITFNWTKFKKEQLNDEQISIGNYDNFSDKQITLAKKSTKELGRDSVLDIKGVIEAELVIAIMNDPEYAYRGTFTEIGAALSTNKHIFVFNKNKSSKCMTNCFYWHPRIIHFSSWESLKNAIEHLSWWYD